MVRDENMIGNQIPPRINHRKCGGVPALSGVGNPLQIGITAASEAEAKERFWPASEPLRGPVER